MRIGIISEGGADTAVITNILRGITGFDSSAFVPIRPKLNFDNTNLQHLDSDQKGGWSMVKYECENRQKINDFFSLEDSSHIVIHIDTAEIEGAKIERPKEGYHEYCKNLRNLVKTEINNWLGASLSDQILYAIAVEEIDAWVMILYQDKETCHYRNAKGKLSWLLQKKKENTTSNYSNYLILSREFSKKRVINNEKLLGLNCSLNEFCLEAKNALTPLIR